jgi:hypothetical protein
MKSTKTVTSFDPTNYVGDFAWVNPLSVNRITQEDRDLIDELCSQFDWARVSNSGSDRIGPRSGRTPREHHDVVVNILTLAGFALHQDPDWASLNVYYIYKP